MPESAWDIIFPDICVWDVHAMIDLLFLRRKLGNGMYRALPLKNVPWVATTSYIVNRASKQKLLNLISDAKALDVAYDLRVQATN